MQVIDFYYNITLHVGMGYRVFDALVASALHHETTPPATT